MTDGLLLAEELFLLTHDDESGASKATIALPNALAGALLLDLALAELLTAEGKDLVPVPGSPSHPLLTDALTQLSASDRPRSASHWVTKLPGALKPLEHRVGGSLAERGVLREEQHKTLGLFSSTRYVQSDPGPEAALRRQLDDVLVGGTTPDAQSALLISLLHAMGGVGQVTGKEHRKQARERAKEIADAGVVGTPVTKAVAASVQAVQVAVMTAAIIPAITGATS